MFVVTFLARILPFSLLLFCNLGFALPIVNGDFSSGLNSWTTSGFVFESSEIARLQDGCNINSANACSTLYQLVQIDSGEYTLEFEFNSVNLLANKVVGVFPDTAFGSLYFDNDGSFNINTLNFDSVIDLFDVDFNGANFGANVSNQSLGDGWILVTYNFTVLSTVFVAPVFELFDLDFKEGSSLLVDNVSLTKNLSVVPEPTSLALLVGAFAVNRKRFRRLS